MQLFNFIAWLPPVAHMHELCNPTQVQVVSYPLLNIPEYASFVRECTKRGAVILNNGVYETGVAPDYNKLMVIASEQGFKEVIIPDAPGNSVETIRLVASAIVNNVAGIYTLLDRYDITLAFAPQGRDLRDWVHCFQHCLQMLRRNRPKDGFTVCVPKSVSKFTTRSALVRDYIAPMLTKMDSVHFLGWEDSLIAPVRELQAIKHVTRNTSSQYYNWDIRSIDTSKPFVHALNNVKWEYGENIPTVRRPHDYFSQVLTRDQLEIAKHNMLVFTHALQGDQSPKLHFEPMRYE